MEAKFAYSSLVKILTEKRANIFLKSNFGLLQGVFEEQNEEFLQEDHIGTNDKLKEIEIKDFPFK